MTFWTILCIVSATIFWAGFWGSRRLRSRPKSFVLMDRRRLVRFRGVCIVPGIPYERWELYRTDDGRYVLSDKPSSSDPVVRVEENAEEMVSLLDHNIGIKNEGQRRVVRDTLFAAADADPAIRAHVVRDLA